MNTSPVDIQLFRCFDALVAERSVTRAAERLNMSQPNMSHVLARLRRMFDDPLLLRSQGGMVATRRALEVNEAVQRILAEVDRVFVNPGPFRPETSAISYVLTATEYVEYLLSPKIVSTMMEKAPNISIEIRTPSRERALEWLEKGEVDFRLGWLRDPPPALHYKVLFRDRLVCIARKGHPALRTGLTLEKYFALQHVRPQFVARGSTGRLIDDTVAAHGGKLSVALSVHNFLTVFETVAASNMIATVPQRVAQRILGQLPLELQVLKPPLDFPELRACVYWHERSHRQPSHRWFRQVLVDIARAL